MMERFLKSIYKTTIDVLQDARIVYCNFVPQPLTSLAWGLKTFRRFGGRYAGTHPKWVRASGQLQLCHTERIFL